MSTVKIIFCIHIPINIIYDYLTSFIYRLVEWFRLPIVPKYVNQYVMNVVKQSVELRAKDKNPRQDLMQFLIDLNDAQSESEKEKIEMIAAQVVLFYLAGVDTSSSGIAYAVFEMARNPEIVKKLRHEIDTVLGKHNNQITYESLQDMPYLELCIKGKGVYNILCIIFKLSIKSNLLHFRLK